MTPEEVPVDKVEIVNEVEIQEEIKLDDENENFMRDLGTHKPQRPFTFNNFSMSEPEIVSLK